MFENATQYNRLPNISSSRRTASASKFSTSSRNSSRSSCNSFSPHVTPIRASRSANSNVSRGSVISSNCDTWSNKSISDLSCEELTDYQLRRQRTKHGKFGKLFQNYFPEKVEEPPEISDPSDDEPYETDLEDDIGVDLIRREKGRHRHEHEYKYGQFCEQLQVVPNNFFLRNGKTEELNMKYRYLNYGDATAMARLIKTQDMVSKLNLADNGIGPAAMLSLAELLLANKTITELNLANNRVGAYGARLMKIVMQNNNKLTKIDISGNCIGEKGGICCAHIIQNNIYVKEFNLANNKIGDKGAVAIGKALGNNVTLELLDVSWNHIQLTGSLAIARGLKNNEELKVLRLAMNGLSKIGTHAVVECLPNSNMVELDLSYNRIGGDGARFIAETLKKITKLHILKLSGNPLTPDGANKILHVISEHNNCLLKHLELMKVIVDDEFITAAQNLRESKNIEIHFSIDLSRRKSARELSRSELEELAAILENHNVVIRDVFDDVMSANSMIRVEDFVNMVEMSDKCCEETVKAVKTQTSQKRNQRFMLKDLLSVEEQRLTREASVCITDISDARSSVSSPLEQHKGNEFERLLTPKSKSSRKANKLKKKRN